MGLIKAALGSAGGVLADQWKEFFYCEALPADVLVTKGKKKVTGRSSNTKGDENIISNGSVIAVADGQAMLIVEQGKVVEVSMEPGEYTYDTSTEPSIFAGDFGESIRQVFQNVGKRFTFGGEAPKDQRVYYFNTKDLIGNKYGTASPVPFRVVDQRAGIDMDIAIRCFGEYSYRITTPAAPAPDSWTCTCGQAGNTGKFCAGCGQPKPAPPLGPGLVPAARRHRGSSAQSAVNRSPPGSHSISTISAAGNRQTRRILPSSVRSVGILLTMEIL